jgi:cold shock CspA family protein
LHSAIIAEHTQLRAGSSYFAKSDGPIDGVLDGEVFIHARCLARCGIKSVKAGDRIEFDVRPGRQKGVEAQNIKLLLAVPAGSRLDVRR